MEEVAARGSVARPAAGKRKRNETHTLARRSAATVLAVATALLSAPSPAPRRTATVVHGGRKATPLGRGATSAGKAATVASVKDDIENAALLFAVDADGINIKVIDDLRRSLPETAKARVVKNSLMSRAGAAGGWDDAVMADFEPLLKRSNVWLFSPQDDMKATVKAFETWKKTNALEKDIKGGLFDGVVLDAAGVNKVKDLPTMPELMTRLAVGINAAGSLGIAKAVKNAKGNPRQIAVAVSKIEGDKLSG